MPGDSAPIPSLESGPAVVPPTALLEAIIGSAMDAIVALDAAGRIVLFNRAAEAMFRCPAAEALGQPLDSFLPAHQRAAHGQYVASFRATGVTARAMGHVRPLAALRADGEEFPIEATIARVAIQDHAYTAAIIRDITARVQADAERNASLEREAAARAEAASAGVARDALQEILDVLPGGVLLMSPPEAGIEFANLAMSELVFGTRQAIKPTPVYGRDFRFLRFDGTSLPATEGPGMRALRGERVQNLQLVLQQADGNAVPVAVHATRLRRGAAEPTLALVFVQDVTPMRQAEQLKDDFLALVSHELRTPLTAIHGGARVLHNRPDLDPATRAELLSDVVAESERLERLLGNLLSLTEITAGRLRASLEPVLIEPLVKRVTEAIGARAPTHTFVIDGEPGLPPAEADPDLFDEVLRNLYENAVKYSPEGGAIRTTIGVTGDSIVTRISDEGVGIAPADVGAVFERFRRVGSTTMARGMGLGLYLCRGLIEAQGGQIEASSPGLGQGATFTVSLPIATGWAASDRP